MGGHRDRLIDFLTGRASRLNSTSSIAPALGVSYGGKIALLPGQSKAEEFTTLVHELAHELLHKAERRTMTTATVRETEAEAVAFIVGQAVGLEMGTASSDYIQIYAGNAALLAESLEVIQRTSATILRAICPENAEQPNSSQRPAKAPVPERACATAAPARALTLDNLNRRIPMTTAVEMQSEYRNLPILNLTDHRQTPAARLTKRP